MRSGQIVTTLLWRPSMKLTIMPGEAVRIWKEDLGLTDRDLRGALDSRSAHARAVDRRGLIPAA